MEFNYNTTVKDLIDLCEEKDSGTFYVLFKDEFRKPTKLIVVATDKESVDTLLNYINLGKE